MMHMKYTQTGNSKGKLDLEFWRVDQCSPRIQLPRAGCGEIAARFGHIRHFRN